MFTPTLLAVSIPVVEWSPKVAAIMISYNILAIAFTKLTVKYPSEGPALPVGNLMGGFSIATVLAATSLGHVLGACAILGLASIGAL